MAEHVRSEFPTETAAGMPVLEGGPAKVGIESTILDLSRLDDGVGPVLLRPGHISAAQLAEVLGVMPHAPDVHAPRASGTLKAHYAPHTPLSLRSTGELLELAAGHGLPMQGTVAVLALGPAPVPCDPRVVWYQASGNPESYARDLYAELRRLDLAGHVHIAAERLPLTPEWAAVNDRIGRAAAAFAESVI